MGRAHCWMSRYEAEGYADAWDMEADGKATLAEANAICMRWEGHKGAHRFVPPSEIVVQFAPMEGDECV